MTTAMLSCHRSVSVTHENGVEKHATIYGPSYGVKVNETEQYSIIFKKRKTDFGALFQDVMFSVYEHHSDQIIWSDTLRSGSVVWAEDYIIEVTSVERVDGTNTKSRYKFDVLAKTKTD